MLRLRSTRTSLALALAAALLASACTGAGEQPAAPAPKDASRAPAKTTVSTAQPPSTARSAGTTRTTGTCALPPLLRTAAATALDAALARRQLDAAAQRATDRGHRFHMRATLRLADPDAAISPRATATVTGRRTAANASTARLRWRGPLGLLLPNARLRIADDQLAIRIDGPDAAYEPRGSASGVSLDVGRELLMHPFLLTTRAAWRAPSGHTHVQLAVPAAALRDYATRERQGPVTELLRDATTLRLTATLNPHGRLVGDRFTLATRVPAGVVAPALDGRYITLSARTGYC